MDKSIKLRTRIKWSLPWVFSSCWRGPSPRSSPRGQMTPRRISGNIRDFSRNSAGFWFIIIFFIFLYNMVFDIGSLWVCPSNLLLFSYRICRPWVLSSSIKYLYLPSYPRLEVVVATPPRTGPTVSCPRWVSWVSPHSSPRHTVSTGGTTVQWEYRDCLGLHVRGALTGRGGGGSGGRRDGVVRQCLRRAAGRDALAGHWEELTLRPRLLLLLPLHPVTLHVPLVLLPVLLHRLLTLNDGDALLPPLTGSAHVGNRNS